VSPTPPAAGISDYRGVTDPGYRFGNRFENKQHNIAFYQIATPWKRLEFSL
jgi:hypothetical protein